MDGYKNEGANNKRSSKIDIVSHALKVSENCVTCVFIFHFMSSDTFKSL